MVVTHIRKSYSPGYWFTLALRSCWRGSQAADLNRFNFMRVLSTILINSSVLVDTTNKRLSIFGIFEVSDLRKEKFFFFLPNSVSSELQVTVRVFITHHNTTQYVWAVWSRSALDFSISNHSFQWYFLRLSTTELRRWTYKTPAVAAVPFASAAEKRRPSSGLQAFYASKIIPEWQQKDFQGRLRQTKAFIGLASRCAHLHKVHKQTRHTRSGVFDLLYWNPETQILGVNWKFKCALCDPSSNRSTH